MTNKTIPNLPAIAAVLATMLVEVDDASGLPGASGKATFAQILTFIQAAIVNGSPVLLDTLKELADSIADDPNFAATMATALGLKLVRAGDTMGGALNWAVPVVIASSATPAIGAAAGNVITYTGAVTTTGFDSIAAGAVRWMRCTGAPLFVHNAASMILPRGGRSIQASAGDTFAWLSLGSGNWFCLYYQPAAGWQVDGADAAAAIIIKDEFLFSSTETGEQGELGWSFTNGTMNLSPSDVGHPGISARASTAVAAVIASTYPGGGAASSAVRFDQVDECVWVVKPVSALADHDVRFGFSIDFGTATPTAGWYFEKLATDTNWFAVSRNASTDTRVDTGVAYAASWFTLRLVRTSATQVLFYIAGILVATITTNIPGASAALVFGCHIIPTTALAKTVWLDFFSLRLLPQAR